MSKHRFDSQIMKLLRLLSDGKPHRTDEIQRVVYGSAHLGAANFKARIEELRREGYNIPYGVQDKDTPSLYWFQLLPGGTEPPKKRQQIVEQLPNGSVRVTYTTV